MALRSGDGYRTYLRSDIPELLIKQLRRVPAEQIFHDSATVLRLLATVTETPQIDWHGHAYVFPHAPSSALFPDVVAREHGFAVVVNEAVVSWAWSVRSNPHASELAVETQPAFRQQGYAYQVAAAWAEHQRAQGKVAFYSHKAENTASAALAAKLGVTWFVEGIGYA